MSEKARPFLFKTGSTTIKAPRLKFANGTLTFTAGEAVYTAPSGGGGGGGAPTDAQYLTLATDATLTQERTLSLTLPLSGSDGGAGAAYTMTLSGWSGTTDGDMLYRNGTAVGSKTAAQARTWLSLVVGTNVQAWSANLDTFAALATDGLLIRSTTWQIATLTAPLQRSGATLSVAAATTSAAGVVELATDGETGAAVVVTGSDSRLARAPSLWATYGQVFPRGTVSPPSYVGRGALSAAGVNGSNASEANFPVCQLGDASAFACRFVIVGAFRLDEGTWTIDYVFKLGSDISTGNQNYWIGMFNGTTLDSADPPATHRLALRFTDGTDTNWMLATKDGTTPNNVDSGVAVTADYYYVVRLRATTTTYTAQIGRGVTLAAAILDFASFTPVANNSNLPGASTDLQIIASVNRSSAAATRAILSGPMYWRCDL